jgi:hypothetical protein
MTQPNASLVGVSLSKAEHVLLRLGPVNFLFYIRSVPVVA